jgi:hypothetical protein
MSRASITPHGTAAAVDQLIDYYQLTGERKYLARVPGGHRLDRQCRAAARETQPRTAATSIETTNPGTGRLIGTHRRGSNAQNGEYWSDFDTEHTQPEKHIDVAALRQRYERVAAMTPEQATRDSALLGRGPSLLPRYLITHDVGGSDLNVTETRQAADDAALLLDGVERRGLLAAGTAHHQPSVSGRRPGQPPPGFVDRGQVGDDWDTSPFTEPSGPMGISTGTYINNMSRLIRYLDGHGR